MRLIVAELGKHSRERKASDVAKSEMSKELGHLIRPFVVSLGAFSLVVDELLPEAFLI